MVEEVDGEESLNRTRVDLLLPSHQHLGQLDSVEGRRSHSEVEQVLLGAQFGLIRACRHFGHGISIDPIDLPDLVLQAVQLLIESGKFSLGESRSFLLLKI